MDHFRIFAFLVCLLSSAADISARNTGTRSMGTEKMPSMDGTHPAGTGKPGTDSPGMEAIDGELAAVMNLCNVTYPTPVEYLTVLNETGEFPAAAPRESKCYLHCVFARLGLLDGNGTANPAMMDKWFVKKGDEDEDDDSHVKAFERCFARGRLRDEDRCAYAYEGFSCLMKEAITFHSEGHKNGKM